MRFIKINQCNLPSLPLLFLNYFLIEKHTTICNMVACAGGDWSYLQYNLSFASQCLSPVKISSSCLHFNVKSLYLMILFLITSCRAVILQVKHLCACIFGINKNHNLKFQLGFILATERVSCFEKFKKNYHTRQGDFHMMRIFHKLNINDKLAVSFCAVCQ